MRRLIFAVLLSTFLLIACTQKESSQASPDSNAPHATILTRDGTAISGTVRSTTPSEITLNMDDGGTRTILTKNVRSVEYGEPAANTKKATTGDKKATAANDEHGSADKGLPHEPRNVSNAAAQPEAPPEARYHPDKSAIQTKTFEIPAGAEVSVRNDETIDSAAAVEGQTYAADVTTDVRDANGAVVIPRGANAQLVIKSASKGGRIRGSSDLIVALQSISVDGKQYLVNTTDLRKEGEDGIGKNKRTGTYVGGGAALGAIIGAIAGKGKGAAIGAASGAGAGAVAQVLTKGNSIKIPAETLMTFRLDQPLRISERR